MGDQPKLPVFHLVGEAFSFCTRKFAQIAILNIVSFALFAGPIILLISIFFHEYFNSLAGQVEELTKEQWLEINIRLFPIRAMTAGATILLAPVVHTSIISSITHGRSVMLPSLNRNMLRYLFASSILGSLAAAVIMLGGSFAALGYVGTSHLPSLQQETLVIAGCILGAGTIYALVRLSLVPAEVVASSKLGVTRGFELSKGSFWRLLFAYLVTAICAILIAFLIAFLSSLLISETGPQMKTWIWSIPGTKIIFPLTLPDVAASPATAAWKLLSLAAQVFLTALAAAVPAFAVAHLNGTTTISGQEEVLDEIHIGQ